MTKDNEIVELFNVLIKERENTKRLENDRTMLIRKLEEKLVTKPNDKQFDELKKEIKDLKKMIQFLTSNERYVKKETKETEKKIEPAVKKDVKKENSKENPQERLAELQEKYLNLKQKFLQTAMKVVE